MDTLLCILISQLYSKYFRNADMLSQTDEMYRLVRKRMKLEGLCISVLRSPSLAQRVYHKTDRAQNP